MRGLYCLIWCSNNKSWRWRRSRRRRRLCDAMAKPFTGRASKFGCQCHSRGEESGGVAQRVRFVVPFGILLSSFWDGRDRPSVLWGAWWNAENWVRAVSNRSRNSRKRDGAAGMRLPSLFFFFLPFRTSKYKYDVKRTAHRVQSAVRELFDELTSSWLQAVESNWNVWRNAQRLRYPFSLLLIANKSIQHVYSNFKDEATAYRMAQFFDDAAGFTLLRFITRVCPSFIRGADILPFGHLVSSVFFSPPLLFNVSRWKLLADRCCCLANILWKASVGLKKETTQITRDRRAVKKKRGDTVFVRGNCRGSSSFSSWVVCRCRPSGGDLRGRVVPDACLSSL